MDSRAKFGLYAIGFVILLLIISEIARPKPVNWRDSYSSFDKIPLGCYVLKNELSELAGNKFIYTNDNIVENLSLHEKLYNKSSLLLVNNSIFLDQAETNDLLNYVEKGNDVFISALNVGGAIADSLHFNIYRDYNRRNFAINTIINGFYNNNLKNVKVNFNQVIESSYFSIIDTTKTVALGYSISSGDTLEEEHINFIKIPYGTNKGSFYIHTNPYAFTNYHLLNGNEKYAETSLSYITNNKIIWDDYYKSGRRQNSSPLRYILKKDALKWAIYLTIIALIMFVIFRGKRTQRIIPVIEPIKNYTLDFTRAIGNLYFEHRDYTNIIHKKITFFLEHIRTRFYLDTNDLNKKFITNLTIKAGKTPEETNDIINYILYLTNKPTHTEEDLIDLNTKIERFLNN